MRLRTSLITISLFNACLFAGLKGAPPCECLLPEEPIQDKQCPAAYNLPASIAVANKCGSVADLFVDLSYTYWLAGEDGLDLGRSGNFIPGDDPFYLSETTVLSQSFEYASGFKVGAGWRRNDWVLAGEYTWVRNTTSQSSSAPLLDPDVGTVAFGS
jgi:hypothetical protein